MKITQKIQIATFALLALVGTSLPAHAEITELNRIVAVVNDGVITAAELDKRLAGIKHDLTAKGVQLPADSALRPQVLERMILDKIQLQQAKQNNIHVDDEDLNQIIGNIAQQNKMTLDQFRQRLEKGGVNFADFRDQIRHEVLITRLRTRQVDSRVIVTPQEVDNYLKAHAAELAANTEYHLAHILIAVPEGAGPSVINARKQKADDVLKQLQGGADFNQLAVRYSDGQQALSGGDLGWRKAGQLPTLFSDLVPTMQAGQISGVLRSASGFHIIKLLAKRGEAKHVVEQTHARHILIRTGPMVSDSDAKARLERLRERILQGEDFAALAKANSDDPGSGANGGDLGWANPGTFVPAFTDAMNKLKVGEISQPVKSQFGWHIIQVLGRRQYDDTQELLKTQAADLLRKRKIDEETEQWLRRLRDEAYVEVRLND